MLEMFRGRVSHLQLPDDLFTVIFRTNIDTHCYQIATVDILLPDTPLAIFYPLYPLSL